MPSSHTTNYNLNQWAADDKVLRADFNADNAKIDAALKALNTSVSAQQTTLGQKGNCQIAVGTYTGSGKCGADNPTTITFPFPPKLVFVQCVDGAAADFTAGSQSDLASLTLVAPVKRYYLFQGHAEVVVSWRGESVTFYHSILAEAQMNINGKTYVYAALG